VPGCRWLSRGRSGQTGGTTSAARRHDQRHDSGAGPVTVMGVGLHLSQIDEADELLTNDPLALLIGMVLDQPNSESWSGAGRSAPT